MTPTAEEAPDGYDPGAYPPLAVTVDVVVLTIRERDLHVLLVERDGPPFEGAHALPGGFVHPDESLEDAARRELQEETGVEATHLEQLGTYGDPDRDPRMRVVSVAHLAVMRRVPPIAAGSDAADASLVPVRSALGADRELAFDHRRILEDAVDTVRDKLEHTNLATAFVGPEFTLSELRSVYEAGWDTALDPANFRRKVLANELASATGRTRQPGPEGGKPAEVYLASRAAPVPLASPMRAPDRSRSGRRRRKGGDET